MMLTRDLRKEYATEGYAVIRGYLDAGALAVINEQMAQLFRIQVDRLGLDADRGKTREALRKNALTLLQNDVPAYIATARITQELPSVHRLLVSEPVVDLAKSIGLEFPVISTKASIHIMADDLKVPGGYHKSPAHQDWRSIQGSLDNVVLWIPTTPVGAQSSPLEVVPQSHLLGLLDTVEHIMTPTVADERITDASFVSVAPVEPGDVIVFSSLLVHRTGRGGDGSVRIALSTRFNNALEKTYVQRGYPTAYKYSYRLDLMMPDFPSADDVSSAFGM